MISVLRTGELDIQFHYIHWLWERYGSIFSPLAMDKIAGQTGSYSLGPEE